VRWQLSRGPKSGNSEEENSKARAADGGRYES